MNNMFNRYAEFPKHQVAITPSDTLAIPKGPLIVMALTDGTLIAVDNSNSSITYTVAAGDILPLLVKRIGASSTATCVGLY